MPMPCWVLVPSTGRLVWANAAGRAVWQRGDGRGGPQDEVGVRDSQRTDLVAIADRLRSGKMELTDWTIVKDGIAVTYSCCTWSVGWYEQPAVAFIALPDPITPATAAQLQRDRILAAVATSADRLLAQPGGLVQAGDLVAALGQAADVDRSYLFHFIQRPDGADDSTLGMPRIGEWIARQAFEWCAPGIPPVIDNPELQAMDMVAGGFVRWVSRFRVGLPIVSSGEQDMPASEWEFLSEQGITAICVQPIRIDNRLIGFLGFDVVAANRSRPFYGWTAHTVDALSTGAHLLGAAFRMAELDGLTPLSKAR